MSNPVAWFEIVGRNGDALRAFYGGLFDWKIDASDTSMDYGLVPPAPGGIGGGIGRSQDGGAGHVTVYVEVDDPAACLARAEQLGGSTLVPPMRVAGLDLTIAFFADPEGHVVGLSRGANR
jgi:predicted enzyme related to lactoylglutathione lyase